MITIRQAHERGQTRTPWLDSNHTFSFNRYYDPRYTGFRDLLVINEDCVAPGMGFGTHGHHDMEIISYPEADRRGTLRLIASRDGQHGSVTVRQDVRLYVGTLDAGATLTYRLGDDRHAWVQVVRGVVVLNGTQLAAGDGAAVSHEVVLQLHATEAAELLLFDLA